MTAERILNALPSPADVRDVPASAGVSVALAGRYLLTGLGPLLDQGSTPECTAYSAVGLRQYHEKRDGHGVAPFSPAYLYALVKDLELRETGLDFDGAYLRDVLRVLKGSGTPLDTGRRGTKIAGYSRVTDTLIGYKTALLTGVSPLYFRIDWPQSWMSLPYSKILRAPGSALAGGHALLIFGWDDAVGGGSWLIRNSWGRWSTGGNGNAYLPYRYLAGLHPEAWLVADIVGD